MKIALNTLALLALAVFVIPNKAISQDTTSASDLEHIISELRNGNPDYDDMEITLKVAVRDQLPQVENWLQLLGRVRDIEFEGAEQGIDHYLVTHEGGKTIWKFARSPSGKIAVLWFNGI